MRRSLVFAVLALAGCQQAAPSHTIPLHDTEVIADVPAEAPSIVSLAHGGEGGPFPVNTEMELAVTATDPAGEGLTYAWSASGGTVEARGARAVWRTPAEPGVYALSVKVSSPAGASARTRVNVAVSSAISGDVVAFQGNGAPGAVENDRDQVGDWCSIDVDSRRRPHLSYFNQAHSQTRYAHWDGTQWVLRIVDGPGFNTGRATRERSFVKVGADGHPRIAYETGEGVFFAQWNGTSWLRSATSLKPGNVSALALDPSRQDEPALLYRKVPASADAEAALLFAQRAGGVWSEQTVLSFGAAQCPSNRYFSEATLAFSPEGTAHSMVWSHCAGPGAWDNASRYRYPYRGGLAYLERNPTTGVWASDYLLGSAAEVQVTNLPSPGSSVRLVRSASGAMAVATSGNAVDASTGYTTSTSYAGLFFRAPGTIGWKYSFVDPNFSRFDVGLAPGDKPVLTTSHGGLELVTTDPQGFWTYTYVGTPDSASSPLSLAVDADGQPHLCYTVSGSLRYF